MARIAVDRLIERVEVLIVRVVLVADCAMVVMELVAEVGEVVEVDAVVEHDLVVGGDVGFAGHVVEAVEWHDDRYAVEGTSVNDEHASDAT